MADLWVRDPSRVPGPGPERGGETPMHLSQRCGSASRLHRAASGGPGTGSGSGGRELGERLHGRWRPREGKGQGHQASGRQVTVALMPGNLGGQLCAPPRPNSNKRVLTTQHSSQTLTFSSSSAVNSAVAVAWKFCVALRMRVERRAPDGKCRVLSLLPVD